MMEYLLVLLVLFFGSVSFYLAYERFQQNRRRKESSTYVQALKDLLDDNQEAAFGKLRQVVADDSNNIDAYLRLGKILRENGQPQRAMQVHKDMTLRRDLSKKQKKEILRHLSNDYIALNDIETVQNALKEIIGIDNSDHSAHVTLLNLLETTGKWEEAYEIATNILKIERNKSKKSLARYKYELGQKLIFQREYHKARIILKEAIGLDSQFVKAYLAIGDSYREEERFEDAVSFWNKLISAVPEQGHLVIDRLKKTLFDLGRFGEIVTICDDILKHDLKNIVARRTLAEIHEKKGDLQSASEVLEQIIDDYPDDLDTILELTRIYLDAGDKKKIDLLRRSLERKKDSSSISNGSSLPTKTSPTNV